MEIIFHSTELFSGSIYLKSLTNGALEQYLKKKKHTQKKLVQPNLEYL